MNRQYKERKIADLDVVEIPGDPDKGAIVLLHGFGASAFDLLGLAQVFPGPTWIFPQGPLEIPFSRDYTGRAWFPVNIELLSALIQQKRFDLISNAFPSEITPAQVAIDHLLTQLDIPRSKIVLGGFSQGAVLSIETTLRSFQKCGGLLIFSGTLINEQKWRELAPLHAKTPFFQSHGSNDSLLPLIKAKELEQILVTSGLQGELHAFPGGHEIPPSILIKLSAFLKQIFI